MKILYWNARGFGNPDTRLFLQQLCFKHKPYFVFIAEPWILLNQVPFSFWNRLKMKSFIENDRNSIAPNLWGICVEGLSPVFISASSQYASFSVLWNNQQVFISAIDASTTYPVRR